jgi:two-component system cell cycle sensor histidine kinase/response regulator CckA
MTAEESRPRTGLSLEFLEQALNRAPDSLYLVDGQGRIVCVNDAACRTLGYSREELLSIEAADIDPRYTPEKCARHMETPECAPFETRHRTRDGRIIPVELHASRFEFGGKLFVLAVARDITGRKQMEEALASREHALAEAQRIGRMGSWELDLTTNTLAWSDEIFRIFEIDPAQFGASYEAFLNAVHPDDREYVNNAYTESLKNQASYDIEHRLLLADGRIKHVHERCETTYAADGTPLHSRGTVQDITDRKRMEEALAVRERQFRTLAENSPDNIHRYDTRCGVIYANPHMEKTMGLSLHNVLGRSPMELFPDGEYRQFQERMEEVLRTGESAEMEVVVCHTEKGDRYHHVRLTPERDLDGFIIGVLAIGRDITGLKRMEQELVKAEKLESLGVLAGGIAHDFNNTLMAIMGHISIARECIAPGSGASDSLDVATEACQEAMALSRRLISFAREGEPVRRPVAIGPLLRTCLALHGNGIQVELHSADDIGMVEADEGQLLQVFGNLAVNAGQAMPGGGKLSVRAENVVADKEEQPGLAPGPYVRITFSDEGCGIPEEILNRIFDPYFTTKKEGTGLGLASSHFIVTRHGGKISASSRPGSGTVFTIHLPRRGEALPATPVRVEPNQQANRTGDILVMDDDENVSEVTVALLKKLGYGTTLTAEGSEAVAFYREAMAAGSPFAAAILDLSVGDGMGGMEAAPRFLELDPNARLIVASGSSSDPVMTNLDEYGFRAALAKPYTLGQLKAALEAACAGAAGVTP